ncbi:hypothetical protein AB0B89_27145 [Sphaerisporangium sp. NPDC049002]|uniref:hypothetical protein n=1 Tax=Sphaerisporangium sp. NPDC049002 TaxID=3155392 RepID=UPI0033E52375
MTQLDQLGPVSIGAREIYDELKTVGVKVDHVSSQLDGVVADVADHETRLRAIERNRWPLPALAALVAVASLVLTLITFIKGGGA